MGKYSTIINIRETASSEAPPPNEEILREDEERPRAPILPLKQNVLDHFVGLRDAILRHKNASNVQILGITSSRQSEGKTTISICLALAFAMDTQRRVLLVDANFRSPAIHKYFHIPVQPGLSDIIRDETLLNDAIVRIHDYSLSLLPIGSMQGSAVELLALDSFKTRIADLRRFYDTIIIDTSSIKEYPDFNFIGPALDGVILVVEADSTQLPIILETKSRLESANIQILGVTMNHINKRVPSFLIRRIGLG